MSTSSNSILLASRNLTTSCCFFFICREKTNTWGEMFLWNHMYKFPTWTRFDCSLSKATEPPLPQKRVDFCRPHTPPTPWSSRGWLSKPWHSDFYTEFWGTSQTVWEGQTRSEVGDSLSFLGAITTPLPPLEVDRYSHKDSLCPQPFENHIEPIWDADTSLITGSGHVSIPLSGLFQIFHSCSHRHESVLSTHKRRMFSTSKVRVNTKYHLTLNSLS